MRRSGATTGTAAVRRPGAATMLAGLALALGLAGCGAEPAAAPRGTPTPTTTASATPMATPKPLHTETPTPGSTTAPPAAPTNQPPQSPTGEPPAGPVPSVPVTPVDGDGSSVPAHLVGLDLERIPTDARVVALTFDAGGNDAALASILATLAAKDVPASFFLTGEWTDAHPDQAREISTQYPIGNHSVSHPDLTTLSDAAARAEVVDAEVTIRSVTGQDPKPWWRFPLGARDDRTIDLVNQLGYGSFRWTVDSLGWQGTSGGMSAAAVHDRVLDALQPGEIVLFHVGSHPTDGSTLDADALPGIIDAIRAAGYGFVTLDAVVGSGG